MIEGKVQLGFNGPLVDCMFCDICGWGDTVKGNVEVKGYGTYDLCHRCNTPEKFIKRIKLFSAYRILKPSASFEEKKKLLNSVDNK